jgi:hypothetical protein
MPKVICPRVPKNEFHTMILCRSAPETWNTQSESELILLKLDVELLTTEEQIKGRAQGHSPA